MGVSKVFHLLKVIKNEDISIEEVVEIVEKRKLKKIDELKKDEAIELSLSQGKTLKELLSTSNYDYVDSFIESHIHQEKGKILQPKKKLYAQLFEFSPKDSVEDIVIKMKRKGFRPANLLELIILGSICKESKTKSSIVALGNLWTNSIDETCVAFLSFDEKSQLNACPVNKWLDDDLFLGVRQAHVKKESIHRPYRYMYFYPFKIASKKIKTFFKFVSKTLCFKKKLA